MCLYTEEDTSQGLAGNLDTEYFPTPLQEQSPGSGVYVATGDRPAEENRWRAFFIKVCVFLIGFQCFSQR